MYFCTKKEQMVAKITTKETNRVISLSYETYEWLIRHKRFGNNRISAIEFDDPFGPAMITGPRAKRIPLKRIIAKQFASRPEGANFCIVLNGDECDLRNQNIAWSDKGQRNGARRRKIHEAITSAGTKFFVEIELEGQRVLHTHDTYAESEKCLEMLKKEFKWRYVL